MRTPASKVLSKEAMLFKRFSISAILFLISIGTVVYVNMMLEPSTMQELAALLGILFSVPSALMAAYCYLKLLLARFQNFKKR